LSHSASLFLYWVSQTICTAWLWTMIFLISDSSITRITGVNHQCRAYFLKCFITYWETQLSTSTPMVCLSVSLENFVTIRSSQPGVNPSTQEAEAGRPPTWGQSGPQNNSQNRVLTKTVPKAWIASTSELGAVSQVCSPSYWGKPREEEPLEYRSWRPTWVTYTKTPKKKKSSISLAAICIFCLWFLEQNSLPKAGHRD
jgi:hypothetical protein